MMTMQDWERTNVEAKRDRYRDRRLALEVKRDAIEAQIIFCDRKIAEFEQRLAETK